MSIWSPDVMDTFASIQFLSFKETVTVYQDVRISDGAGGYLVTGTVTFEVPGRIAATKLVRSEVVTGEMVITPEFMYLLVPIGTPITTDDRLEFNHEGHIYEVVNDLRLSSYRTADRFLIRLSAR